MRTSGEELRVLVFDLNGTFYNKSSKDEFYKFICSKQPRKILSVVEMTYFKALQKLHQINQTEFKENFFNYLNNIPPEQVEAYAREFWQREYPQQFNQELKLRMDRMRSQGVKIFCATGALELYVKPLFDLYPVDGFAGTKVNYVNNTYLVEGEACKDGEKLRRLEKHFGKSVKIVEAYSDSKEEILNKADRAFLVKKGILTPYRAYVDI